MRLYACDRDGFNAEFERTFDGDPHDAILGLYNNRIDMVKIAGPFYDGKAQYKVRVNDETDYYFVEGHQRE